MAPRAPRPASASWLGLLATATFGAQSFGQVRARILGDLAEAADGGYRLVVQSYDPDALDPRGLPQKHAKPNGSLQRAVTAEELEQGVLVSLVQVDARSDRSVLLAWVERGEPTLDFDARNARPSADAALGTSRLERGVAAAELVLARGPSLQAA